MLSSVLCDIPSCFTPLTRNCVKEQSCFLVFSFWSPFKLRSKFLYAMLCDTENIKELSFLFCCHSCFHFCDVCLFHNRIHCNHIDYKQVHVIQTNFCKLLTHSVRGLSILQHDELLAYILSSRKISCVLIYCIFLVLFQKVSHKCRTLPAVFFFCFQNYICGCKISSLGLFL